MDSRGRSEDIREASVELTLGTKQLLVSATAGAVTAGILSSCPVKGRLMHFPPA